MMMTLGQAAALNALLSAHNCGIKLPLSVYHKTDLKQDVTMHLRLVDDAFIKTCDMVNDISVACQSSCHQAPVPLFGEQCLDFLVDLFDDEIQSVSRITTTEGLNSTVHALLDSLKKYPPMTGSLFGDRRGALFMMEIFSRAQQAGSLPRLDAQKTWQCCVDDLLTIVELHTHLSATAQCAAMFLQSQLLINKVLEALSHGMLLSSDVPTQVGVSHITHCIKELLLHGYRLEHMFVDLPTHLVCGGRMVRVVAHCLQLLMNMNTEIKDRDLQKLKQTLIQRISTLARFCELHKLLLPSPVLPLVAMDTTLVANDVLVESLKPVVSNQFCTLVKFSELSNVQLCRAVVVEPHELGREDCVKFVSSLALCICVNATLYHVKDLCQVAVQVRFPDGKKLLFVPKPEEVREVGVTEHRLETSVIISHGMWTDACGVEFCVVLRHQTDVEEETSLVMEHMYTHKAKAGANSAQEGDTLGTLVISNRVMVTIYPQDTTAKGFNVFQ
eukprot:Em0021g856a